MRYGWKQLAVCVLGGLVAGLSGCATMQNIGNSLAFWKKSPPKDQFATKPEHASFELQPHWNIESNFDQQWDGK